MVRLLNNSSTHSNLSQHFSNNQLRHDALFESFSSQAADIHALAAMSAGSTAFSLTRTASSALLANIFRSSSVIGSLSWGTALLGEVSAFRATNQVLSNQANAESWHNLHGMAATTMDFALLKGFSHYLRGENFVTRHGVSASAMVAGELAREATHLSEDTHKNLSERFVHAAVSSIALEAGSHLSTLATGGALHAMERSIHEHNAQQESAREERRESEALFGMAAESRNLQIRNFSVESRSINLHVEGESSEARLQELEGQISRLLQGEMVKGLSGEVATQLLDADTQESTFAFMSGRDTTIVLNNSGEIKSLIITRRGREVFRLGRVEESPAAIAAPVQTPAPDVPKIKIEEHREETPGTSERRGENVSPDGTERTSLAESTNAISATALETSLFKTALQKGAVTTLNLLFEELIEADVLWREVQIQANELLRTSANSDSIDLQNEKIEAVKVFLTNAAKLSGPSDVIDLLSRIQRGDPVTNVRKSMGSLIGNAERRRAAAMSPAAHLGEAALAEVASPLVASAAISGEVARKEIASTSFDDTARRTEGDPIVERTGADANTGGGAGREQSNPEGDTASEKVPQNTSRSESLRSRIQGLRTRLDEVFRANLGKMEPRIAAGLKAAHTRALAGIAEAAYPEAQIHFLLQHFEEALDRGESMEKVSTLRDRMKYRPSIISELQKLSQVPDWANVYEKANEVYHRIILLEKNAYIAFADRFQNLLGEREGSQPAAFLKRLEALEADISSGVIERPAAAETAGANEISEQFPPTTAPTVKASRGKTLRQLQDSLYDISEEARTLVKQRSEYVQDSLHELLHLLDLVGERHTIGEIESILTNTRDAIKILNALRKHMAGKDFRNAENRLGDIFRTASSKIRRERQVDVRDAISEAMFGDYIDQYMTDTIPVLDAPALILDLENFVFAYGVRLREYQEPASTLPAVAAETPQGPSSATVSPSEESPTKKKIREIITSLPAEAGRKANELLDLIDTRYSEESVRTNPDLVLDEGETLPDSPGRVRFIIARKIGRIHLNFQTTLERCKDLPVALALFLIERQGATILGDITRIELRVLRDRATSNANLLEVFKTLSEQAERDGTNWAPVLSLASRIFIRVMSETASHQFFNAINKLHSILENSEGNNPEKLITKLQSLIDAKNITEVLLDRSERDNTAEKLPVVVVPEVVETTPVARPEAVVDVVETPVEKTPERPIAEAIKSNEATPAVLSPEHAALLGKLPSVYPKTLGKELLWLTSEADESWAPVLAITLRILTRITSGERIAIPVQSAASRLFMSIRKRNQSTPEIVNGELEALERELTPPSLPPEGSGPQGPAGGAPSVDEAPAAPARPTAEVTAETVAAPTVPTSPLVEVADETPAAPVHPIVEVTVEPAAAAAPEVRVEVAKGSEASVAPSSRRTFSDDTIRLINNCLPSHARVSRNTPYNHAVFALRKALAGGDQPRIYNALAAAYDRVRRSSGQAPAVLVEAKGILDRMNNASGKKNVTQAFVEGIFEVSALLIEGKTGREVSDANAGKEADPVKQREAISQNIVALQALLDRRMEDLREFEELVEYGNAKYRRDNLEELSPDLVFGSDILGDNPESNFTLRQIHNLTVGQTKAQELRAKASDYVADYDRLRKQYWTEEVTEEPSTTEKAADAAPALVETLAEVAAPEATRTEASAVVETVAVAAAPAAVVEVAAPVAPVAPVVVARVEAAVVAPAPTGNVRHVEITIEERLERLSSFRERTPELARILDFLTAEHGAGRIKRRDLVRALNDSGRYARRQITLPELVRLIKETTGIDVNLPRNSAPTPVVEVARVEPSPVVVAGARDTKSDEDRIAALEESAKSNADLELLLAVVLRKYRLGDGHSPSLRVLEICEKFSSGGISFEKMAARIHAITGMQILKGEKAERQNHSAQTLWDTFLGIHGEKRVSLLGPTVTDGSSELDHHNRTLLKFSPEADAMYATLSLRAREAMRVLIDDELYDHLRPNIGIFLTHPVAQALQRRHKFIDRIFETIGNLKRNRAIGSQKFFRHNSSFTLHQYESPERCVQDFYAILTELLTGLDITTRSNISRVFFPHPVEVSWNRLTEKQRTFLETKVDPVLLERHRDYRNKPIVLMDSRVVQNDGKSFVVEVKNTMGEEYKPEASQVARLQVQIMRYALVRATEPKFRIAHFELVVRAENIHPRVIDAVREACEASDLPFLIWKLPPEGDYILVAQSPEMRAPQDFRRFSTLHPAPAAIVQAVPSQDSNNVTGNGGNGSVREVALSRAAAATTDSGSGEETARTKEAPFTPEVIRRINSLLPSGVNVGRNMNPRDAAILATKNLKDYPKNAMCEAVLKILREETLTPHQREAIAAISKRMTDSIVDRKVAISFVNDLFEVAIILAGEGTAPTTTMSAPETSDAAPNPRSKAPDTFALLSRASVSAIAELERMRENIQAALDFAEDLSTDDIRRELAENLPSRFFARDLLGEESTLTLEQLYRSIKISSDGISPPPRKQLGDDLVSAIEGYMAFYREAQRKLTPGDETASDAAN